MDIDKLELLPKFEKLREIHGNEFGEKYWKHNYSRSVDWLTKIRLDKYVGQHIDDIVSKYIHRLPYGRALGNNRVNYLLYRVFKLENVVRRDDGELCVLTEWSQKLIPLKKYIQRWQKIFYIQPETGILCVKRGIVPTETKRQRSIRLKQEAEKEKEYRKHARDKKKQRQVERDEAYWRYWLQYDQKREKQLNEQKMISKGFDPKTSFRNVPLQ